MNPHRLELSGFAVAVALSSAAFAQTQSWDFVERNTGDIYATLELRDPAPYNHNDVVSLSFTAEGDAVFGLGVGAFTAVPFVVTNNGQIRVHPSGSLCSDGTSTVFMNTGSVQFTGGSGVDGLEFSFSGFDPTASRIYLGVDYFTSDRQDFSANGEWRRVPAPGAALLGLAGLASARRRR